MEGKKKQGERVGRKRPGVDKYSINANRVITNDAEENVLVIWSQSTGSCTVDQTERGGGGANLHKQKV